jgi:hypothetical protein
LERSGAGGAIDVGRTMTDTPTFGNPWARLPCGHLARFAIDRDGVTVCLACEHYRLQAELDKAHQWAKVWKLAAKVNRRVLVQTARLLAQYREEANP